MLVNSGSAHCGESDQFEGGGNIPSILTGRSMPAQNSAMRFLNRCMRPLGKCPSDPPSDQSPSTILGTGRSTTALATKQTSPITSGTKLTMTALAQRHASSCHGSWTSIEMALTGGRWRTGFTITCHIAGSNFSMARECAHSISAGTKNRRRRSLDICQQRPFLSRMPTINADSRNGMQDFRHWLLT